MLKQEQPVEATPKTIPTGRTLGVGLTSLAFALLQSACSAVMAISGLRLLIGIGSLAAATTVTKALDTIHGDWIRIPMTALALLGTFTNLYVLWRIRSLRARPSSQWRQTTVDPRKKRDETIQLWISLGTLVLLLIEWITHIHLFGRLLF